MLTLQICFCFSGGFGAVYRVTRKSDGRVLVLAAKLVDNQGSQLSNEIITSKKLQHHGIVRPVDAMEYKGSSWFLMEFLPCGDLFSSVNRKKLSEADARPLFKQITAAIEYMHIEEYMHGDLKAENIFLDHHNPVFASAKVGDFGEARRVRPGQFINGFAGTNRKIPFDYMIYLILPSIFKCFTPGTIPHMAPEIFNDGELSMKGDCFALGVYGDRGVPIRSRQSCGLVRFPFFNHFGGPLSKDITPQLRDLISSLTENDPEVRLSATDALNHEWCNPT